VLLAADRDCTRFTELFCFTFYGIVFVITELFCFSIRSTIKRLTTLPGIQWRFRNSTVMSPFLSTSQRTEVKPRLNTRLSMHYSRWHHMLFFVFFVKFKVQDQYFHLSLRAIIQLIEMPLTEPHLMKVFDQAIEEYKLFSWLMDGCRFQRLEMLLITCDSVEYLQHLPQRQVLFAERWKCSFAKVGLVL